jgi:cytidylate kinase
MTDAIYIAGPLNSDACGYLQNVSKMNHMARVVESYGAAVFIPGNDLVHGIWCGDLGYEDYMFNSTQWLLRSDAMFVCEGSENSKGVQKERLVAKRIGIPVFDDFDGLKKFLYRPKILAIVGESGTGKTTAAEYIETMYDIPMVRSYTDREPRLGDTSHTFLSKKEFDQIPREDMIVYTEFGGNRYCCQHKDIHPLNTYVIEEDGYLKLKTIYKSRYRVEGFRLFRDDRSRLESIGETRFNRDKNKFILPMSQYEHIYHNEGNDFESFELWLDLIMETFNE